MGKFLLPILLLCLSGLSHAQEIIPGLIPRFYSIEAATDLQMSPEVAHERALSGEDISLIDPDPNTNMWNPKNNRIPDHKLLTKNETVTFIKELPSANAMRFSVLTNDNREVIITFSKKTHNILLRRNILSKLGYETQPMNWVSEIKVNFKDTIDRDIFKSEVKDKFFEGGNRWIKKENDLTLTLQDVLVLTPESEIYNLAFGGMIDSIPQGRRILRAPYIPLALVDTTESVNLFPWQAGRVVLNNIKMNHTQDVSTSFGTSWEDARWIGRRMAKLTRDDFTEIVVKASYPPSVEKILIEKIIGRRNQVMEMLDLLSEAPPIPFNPEISLPPGLIKGEVVQEFFEGYASRFSYGDPESPFSASELGSYALSRAQAEVMNLAMSKLNQLIGTDDQANYTEIVENIIKKEGPYFSTQAVAVPTFHGNITLSRDIITGSYLGTNNKVQLVDNFGFALDAGVFAGIEGLPIPVDFKGGGGVNFQRTYSHVKPVASLKKSLKEPYKNLAIPLIMKDLGQKIDRLSTVQGEAQLAMARVIAGELKKSLSIGESFIVTDTIVPRIMAEGQLSLSQLAGFDKRLLKIYAKAQSQAIVMARYHLHRADEHTFHIYSDSGKELKLMLTLKLKSFVPIIGFNGRWNKATAETLFYPVSLHPSLVTVEMLKALRSSIFSLSNDALDDLMKPHRVEHKIGELADTLDFIMFKRNAIGSDHHLKLTHAKGGPKKEIHRRYDSVTTGIDWEGYAVDAVNELIKSLTNSDLSVSEVDTMNPGFTVGGKAKNRVFVSEYDGRITTNFQRILNGWKVKPKKLRSLVETINKEVGRNVFDKVWVSNTDSILLYQISFVYTLTQEGADQLLSSTPEKIRQVMLKYPLYKLTEEQFETQHAWYVSQIKKIKTDLQKPDPLDGLKRYHKWLKAFQDDVTIMGLEELVGKANIAYQGKIEGFRQGDESGDSSIFSNVYGELPLPLQVSPTRQVMQNWGILEGELLANWFMERAI